MAAQPNENDAIESLKSLAKELGIPYLDKSTPKHADQSHRFFVHGTCSSVWEGKAIDPAAVQRSLDFGPGFYAFEDRARGRKIAGQRAHQKVDEAGANCTPFLLRFKVAAGDLRGLISLDEGEWIDRYEEIVNNYRYFERCDLPSEVLEANVCCGPTARRAGRQWVVNEALPTQYCFRPSMHPSKMMPVALLRVPANP